MLVPAPVAEQSTFDFAHRLLACALSPHKSVVVRQVRLPIEQSCQPAQLGRHWFGLR
jgi:hypothetical protein